MAAIVWQDVIDLQANLEAVAVAAQAAILAYVNDELNPTAFGGETSARFHLARCYLAAHLGEIVRRDGTQDVRGETIARSSVTLTYAGADEHALDQTAWGRQYKAFVRRSPLRIGGGRTS